MQDRDAGSSNPDARSRAAAEARSAANTNAGGAIKKYERAIIPSCAGTGKKKRMTTSST
jgi:hypothetical protein